MRIVLLNDRIPPENRGGAGVIVWHLAQALSGAGHDVHVIAATEKASFEEIREGIPTYHIHVQYPERWRAWLSLYNPTIIKPLNVLFKRLKPDVIHAHNIHSDLTYYALHLARGYCKRLIFTSHDTMPITYGKLVHYVRPDACPEDVSQYRLPLLANLRRARLRYNPFRAPVIRRSLALCDVRIAVSQSLADAHHANRLPAFTVVHNGINPDTMAHPPITTLDALRQRLPINHRPVALMGGRLNREKGLHPALSAFEKVLESVPDALLLVLSHHALDQQIPPQFHHLLNQSIVSAGWLSGAELQAAYQLATVILVPSVYLDPFPTINLEAMSASRPVIATCHGGSSEIVQHNQTGYIVNPYDTAQVAYYMTQLFTSPVLVEQMGQAGRIRLEDHFSMQHHLEAVLRHYHHRKINSI